MNREETLSAARSCVCSDRNAQYGEPEDNFKSIARFWYAYKGVVYSPEDVAVMMALLKIARIKHNPENEDSWVDLCGYAACGCEISTKENK